MGRGGRDLRDAGRRVDLRRDDRRPRVQIADDARDPRVDEALRDLHRLPWIALIVFDDEHELHRLAVDRRRRAVQLVDGELRAVLHVLAQMGDGPRQRHRDADPDDR
ncbi:hypothetical protein Y033_5341 [Burkholderia pseudomallei MSHR435]|nr:hypothetical protein Y033_5341 [Burkholderia pseudomallei MSHR435]